MKTYKFIADPGTTDETTRTIMNNYETRMVQDYNFNISEHYIAGIYRTFFKLFAIALKNSVTKQTKKASFKFVDLKGNFIMGATLIFNEPEEGEDDSGNWVLSYTFNQEDLADSDVLVDNQNGVFRALAQTELYQEIYGNFGDPESMIQLFEGCVESIKEFLDANSDDGEECQLEMDGIFTATVGFEGGERVYSIVPGATVKQIVKNDEALTSE